MIKIRELFVVALLFIVSGCNRQNAEKGKECCNPSDSAIAEPAELGGESLYQLSGSWITEDQQPLELEELKGKIQVVSMIFSHCEYACPRLVADMKIIEEKIPFDKRDQVSFLLVSFDVERDSPERLKEFKTIENLDEKWTLLHGDESLVRMLSVLLDVKYERQSDGNFAHSNVISVLDQNGVVRSRVEGLGADPDPLLTMIENLVK